MENTQNTQLVKIGQTDIQKGGLGFGNSKLFQLKPANLQLVQKMTRAEGAQPGKIRVKETGQHFAEMNVVLLFEPVERRSFYDGEDFSPENLICFSDDMIEPSSRAKVAQAMTCAGCAKADWERYQQTKNKKDIPPCKPFYRAMVIDKETKLPYYVDFRGTSRQPFKTAMQNIARMYALLQSQGKNPNIFDISFTIYPVSQDRGAYYTYGFKNFEAITDEERTAFGSLYIDFVNRRAERYEEEAEKESAADLEASNQSVNNSIVENAGGEAVDGDYITI